MKLMPSSTARRRTARARVRIVGLAPDVLAGQAHGAVAEALHLEVAEADGGGSVGVAFTASGFVHAASDAPPRARSLGRCWLVRPEPAKLLAKRARRDRRRCGGSAGGAGSRRRSRRPAPPRRPARRAGAAPSRARPAGGSGTRRAAARPRRGRRAPGGTCRAPACSARSSSVILSASASCRKARATAHRPRRPPRVATAGSSPRISLSVSATSVARSISVASGADQRGVHGEREPRGALARARSRTP